MLTYWIPIFLFGKQTAFEKSMQNMKSKSKNRMHKKVNKFLFQNSIFIFQYGEYEMESKRGRGLIYMWPS